MTITRQLPNGEFFLEDYLAMRLAHLPMRYAHTAFCRALVAYLKPLRGQVRRPPSPHNDSYPAASPFLNFRGKKA